MNQVMRDVEDPEKKISVQERARAKQIIEGSADERKEAHNREDLRLPALGSGSDYTPFLQFAGIASLNIGYGGEEEYGQYHSIYDSFDHYTKFMDPTFIYGVTLAKTGGRTMLRLANAELLPFEFTGFSDNISKYVKGLQDLADKMRDDNLERTRRLNDKTFDAYFDPTKKYVAPEAEEPVPHLNFAPLENAATRLDKRAQDYKKAYQDAATELQDQNAQRLNEILMFSERALTRKEGLPGRPWFMHQIYAPGIYTGYEPKPLPSISEAIEQKKWKVAEEQIVVVADTLNKFSDEIDRAIACASTESG